MSKEFSDQEREAIQDRIQAKKVKRNEKNKYKKNKKITQIQLPFPKPPLFIIAIRAAGSIPLVFPAPSGKI